MCVCESLKLCLILFDPMDSMSLLQGIFQPQGSNVDFLHGGLILYRLSHQESPYCIFINM